MHHRRLAKNDPEKYNQIHNIVLQKCKEAKEQWLEEKCQEIERQKDQNPKEMFKRIREITGKMVSRPSACIKSSTGEILYEPEDVARRWSEYLGQLFNDFRTNEEFTSHLFNMLKDVGLDEKDQRIIYNLYHLQKGAIKLPNGLTEWTEINRGVRQGCVMSPEFFNLYSEHILRRLEESNDGVTINGVCINNIRYADDSEECLQRLRDLVLDDPSDEGLEINCRKTFCMVVSKERQPPTCNLICNGTGIEQVNSFNYLGSMLTSDGRCEKEIRRRIGMAKTSFNQMSPVLRDRKLSIPLKVRLLKCFIWSVLLYGCESWTLSAALTWNIEAT